MNSPTPPPFKNHYPSALKTAEQTAIHERRARSETDPRTPVVGVALSGGGIRSATFSLGLVQALARQRLLRRVDFLSTVSGGGYFGSFLGTAFSRSGANVDTVERDLSDNYSWPVRWLRENGRFLSPNGSGDNWLSAAVALRNWVALQVVLLAFAFLILGVGTLIRADLWMAQSTGNVWNAIEEFFWNSDHHILGIWWSPWLILPVIPFAVLMVPTGHAYWLTQFVPLMSVLRRIIGWFSKPVRAMTNEEFAGKSQHALTRTFTLGFIMAVTLTGLAVVDSLGQTVYLHWSANDFEFPSLWAMLTSAGIGLFGLGARIAVALEGLLGKRRFRLPSSVAALGLALIWGVLIVVGLSVTACGIAWEWDLVWSGEHLNRMDGAWPLMLAVAICFVASWVFSRALGFVNLSSMQQVYSARLARAYLGATNPERRDSGNHSMTDLIDGDDLRLDAYMPHEHGGPLHLINVTVNETISGKTQIERRDRKGLAMAIGPSGLSVGIDSHALWSHNAMSASPFARRQARWERRERCIVPISDGPGGGCFHALCDSGKTKTGTDQPPLQRIEALPIGRWTAISGAAFTTGTGSNTELGLSLLLGLGNVRLGYWWDSGITSGQSGGRNRKPNFLELASRLVSRILPVQSYLMNEFFARFHGPARRHWYLSDGGHFENTGCYELIRRRVPFIVCSDAGQDPAYEFNDFANLVRKARIDFGAEIQVIRRADDLATDDPGVRFPLPKLEEILHPNLLDVFGTPEDFSALAGAEEEEAEAEDDAGQPASRRYAKCHAILARIHYLDTDEFAWLMLIKPSIMGDEAEDVLQYQRKHTIFPQEPTSDQYFDEAQWESYRKLGEHIGTELFTAPKGETADDAGSWSPSQMRPPAQTVTQEKTSPTPPVARIRELRPSTPVA
ncbi:patatin-like phospholipase family protein [Horticoccus sp. 23ND18S-11]|uniref:patatin-like phospholipase family protein n=1 Tax=Horticoccus sp. 23ND18S-11 TaxID=3391832 RepID=UPI0039C9D035